MLKVQEYLKTHSLKDLERDHGVYARFSTKNPRKFTLNYSQIEVKDGDPIAEECRGLILEQVGDDPSETNVLAHPFNRFYNDGQEYAANIDWSSAKYYEKLDGTLIILYWDPTLNEYCIATRSVPDADVPYEGVTNKTFSDLFKQTIELQYQMSFEVFSTVKLSRHKTYMFELCTPENVVVVKHDCYKTYLIGMRDLNTHEEQNVSSSWCDVIFDVCPSWDLTPETVRSFVLSRDAKKFEGVVLRDWFFNRVKIKNPEYTFNNHIKDRVIKSPRALLEAILLEKDDDLRSMLPDAFIVELDRHKDNLRAWIDEQENFFAQNRIVGFSRKDYAQTCNKHGEPMSVQMFMYENKGGVKDWIKSRKNKDETFSDTFLDNLFQMIGKSMSIKKLTFPCTSSKDRQDALEAIARAGGHVQNHRIDFVKHQVVFSVTVDPENDASFTKFIDSLDLPVKMTSGSRGVLPKT